MVLENPQHEAFAQARFAGKTLVEAHYSAGYAGDKASASRLGQLHEIKERIAELYREAAAQTAYDKTHAVRDLLGIIHACPADAGADNPLCEPRMGKDGTRYRFPPKLQAMARLIKLMAWDKPDKPEVEVVDTLTEWLIKERKHDPFASPPPQLNAAPPSNGDSQEADPPPSDKTSSSSSSDGIPSSIEPASPTSSNNGSTIAQPAPATAQPVLSARQQSFAISRVKGLGIMAAYHAAGYTGDSPNLAWRLSAMPAVKARIAELNGTVEAATGYAKDDAVRDLVAIIRSHPAQAGPDHPLCEERVTSWGSYHRFPSKLAALALLIKLLGWYEPQQEEEQPRDTLKEWLDKVRARS
jgi:hypothetical protein